MENSTLLPPSSLPSPSSPSPIKIIGQEEGSTIDLGEVYENGGYFLLRLWVQSQHPKPLTLRLSCTSSRVAFQVENENLTGKSFFHGRQGKKILLLLPWFAYE